MNSSVGQRRPGLLVLASTYPRWRGDPEPGFVYELCKRLASHFRVIVVCPHASGAPEHEIMDGVEVVRYRYAPFKLETLVNDGGIVTNLKRRKWKWLLVPSFVLMQAWSAWQIMRRESISVLHAHWLIPQGMVAALLSVTSSAKVPFVVTSHGADLYALKGRGLNLLKRWVLRQSAGATVVSSAMLERLEEVGAAVENVSVIPMGVDLGNRFSVDTSVARSTGEILYVGRLVEKKGVRYLIDAMPAVLKRFPMAHLTIAGFGPEDSRLRAQVASLGLGSRVEFLGAMPQEKLPELYRRAAVFVAPFVKADSGDQEGLPVALMEAVACGCPVIAGNVAGIEDLLGEIKGDVCVDACDIAALANRICQDLADGFSARKRAAKILAAAGEKVDWENIVQKYARVIQHAIDLN